MKSKCAIFDFDSTLVTIETLDFLIGKTSKNHAGEIEKITELAMNGKMTFAESLRSRFTNINLKKSDIEELKSEICDHITRGFAEGFNELRNEFDFYIISGGFLEIIYPVADKLHIAREKVTIIISSLRLSKGRKFNVAAPEFFVPSISLEICFW